MKMEQKTDEPKELSDRDCILLFIGLLFVAGIVFSLIGWMLRVESTFPCFSDHNIIVTNETMRSEITLKDEPIKLCTNPVPSIGETNPYIAIAIIFLLMETLYFKVIPKNTDKTSLFEKISGDKTISLVLTFILLFYFGGLYSLAQAIYYNIDEAINIIASILIFIVKAILYSLLLIPVYLWYKWNATKYKK